MDGGALGGEAMMVIRAMTVINEVGLAVRTDGDTLRFVGSIRTLFANPDDVVAKILAIPPADIASGGAVAAASQVATGSPGSPFAQDHAAGGGGLMVPAAMVGMAAAIVIPMFMDSMKKAKKSEAALQLGKIAKSAKVAYITNAEFPRGDSTLTPAIACCTQNHDGKRKCMSTAATWATPVWQSLDFEISEPTLFRYRYVSDGKTFTATAVGDLDCDGVEITYTMQGTATDGNPTTELVPPAPNTD